MSARYADQHPAIPLILTAIAVAVAAASWLMWWLDGVEAAIELVAGVEDA